MEDAILRVAEIAADAAAMSEAVLTSDLDEARFRARLVATRADEQGYRDLALAAAFAVGSLGEVGETPHRGYATAILRVADELGKIGIPG